MGRPAGRRSARPGSQQNNRPPRISGRRSWEDTRKMNAEFFEALAMLEKERGLTADYLIERISNAIISAVKKD